MSIFYRVCGIGVLCAVSALLLRKQSDGVAALLPVLGVTLILSLVLGRYAEVLTTVSETITQTGFGGYGTLMVKSLGVGMVAHVTGGVCRELGKETLAAGIELAGKAEILLLCLPLMGEILTLLQEILA